MPDESELDIDVALKDSKITIKGQTFQCILYYECPICKAPLLAFWKYKEGQKGIDDNDVGRALRDSGFNAYRFFESKAGQGFEYDFEKDPSKKHNHAESSGYGYGYRGSSSYYIPYLTLNPMFTVNNMLKEALQDEAVDAGINTPDKALEVLEALRKSGEAMEYFKVVDDRMKHGKPVLFFNKGKFQSGYTEPKKKLEGLGLKLSIKEVDTDEVEENPEKQLIIKYQIVPFPDRDPDGLIFDTEEEAKNWLKMSELDLPIKTIRGTAQFKTQTMGLTGRRRMVWRPLDENPKGRRFRIVTPAVNGAMRYMKVIGRYFTLEEARNNLPRMKEAYGVAFIRTPENQQLENPSPYIIYNDVYDSHQGEIFGSIYADGPDKKRVGKIDYSYHDGELDIKIIEVHPDYRRKGIGREMMRKLKWEFPTAKIHWGMEVSEEGTAFRKAIQARPNPAPPEEVAKAKAVVQRFTAKKAEKISPLDLAFLEPDFIKLCDTKTELYESDKWNPDGTIKYYYHPWKDGHPRYTFMTSDKKWLVGLGRCRVTKDGIEDFPLMQKKIQVDKESLKGVECWARLATLIGIDVPCGKCSGTLRFIPDDGWHCDKCKGSVPKFKIRRGMVLFDEGTNILLSISKIK